MSTQQNGRPLGQGIDRNQETKQPLTVELYTDELAMLRNMAEFCGLSTAEMGAALLGIAVQRKTAEGFGLNRGGAQ